MEITFHKVTRITTQRYEGNATRAGWLELTITETGKPPLTLVCFAEALGDTPRVEEAK